MERVHMRPHILGRSDGYAEIVFCLTVLFIGVVSFYTFTNVNKTSLELAIRSKNTLLSEDVSELTTTILANARQCQTLLGNLPLKEDISARRLPWLNIKANKNTSHAEGGRTSITNMLNPKENEFANITSSASKFVVERIYLDSTARNVGPSGSKVFLSFLRIIGRFGSEATVRSLSVPLYYYSSNGATIDNCHSTVLTNQGQTIEQRTCAAIAEVKQQSLYGTQENCELQVVQNTINGDTTYQVSKIARQ